MPIGENDNRRNDDTPAPAGLGVEIALCLWFALAIVTFWGPYFGFIAPPLTTALYSVFLIGAILSAALRILKGREADRQRSASVGHAASAGKGDGVG